MAAEHTHDMKLVLTASGLDTSINTFRCNLFSVFSIARRFAATRKLMVVSST